MTTTALILVFLGLAIIVSRGPLIIAPGRTRDTYLHLFDTDRRMRGLGLVFAAVSGAIIWALWGVAGSLPVAITYVAGFIFLLAIFAMMLMPSPFRKLAAKIWGGFDEGILRTLGVLAVIFGAWLVYYGLGL